MKGGTLGAVLGSLAIGCTAATHSSPPPRNHAVDEQAVLREVLSYEVRQYAGRNGSAEVVCAGVAAADGVKDPSDDEMTSLGPRVLKVSVCAPGTLRLVAGPLDWVKEDEVRAKATWARGNDGGTVEYRLVWETDRWVCLGPVLHYDPV